MSTISAIDICNTGSIKHSFGKRQVIEPSFCYRVTIDSHDVLFTDTEYKLYTCLANNSGAVVSIDKIMTTVWSNNYIIEPHNIYSCIFRVRKKMGVTRSRLKTIRGFGYKIEFDDTDGNTYKSAIANNNLSERYINRKSKHEHIRSDTIITIQSVTINKTRHRVTVGDTPVVLTALEYKLLVLLAERAGRVQSRETLKNDVWDDICHIDTSAITTHICRLRKKLGRESAVIKSVRTIGYVIETASTN